VGANNLLLNETGHSSGNGSIYDDDDDYYYYNNNNNNNNNNNDKNKNNNDDDDRAVETVFAEDRDGTQRSFDGHSVILKALLT
jgi:hypothetical protein